MSAQSDSPASAWSVVWTRLPSSRRLPEVRSASPCHIGMQAGIISSTTGAALVCAGLLSVMMFPALAVSRLPQSAGPATGRERTPQHSEVM
jgi:hypothetical protein